MKQKLIKLSDTHYIIVDDSEIKEGDWCYDVSLKIFQASHNFNNYNTNLCKKITYSTKPLEEMNHGNYKSKVFLDIKPLSLSEVEEAINGYSVDGMATNLILDTFPRHDDNSFDEAMSLCRDFYIEGFNAHKELVKDKLFTVEDLDRAFEAGYNARHDERQSYYQSRDILIQSLLPKTEWDVEFVNGKLKLI